MNYKSGIVLEVSNKTAHVLSSNGEFLTLKIIKESPVIGTEYSGPEHKKIPFSRYTSIAASFVFFILLSSQIYAYNIPTSSVYVTMDPAFELKTNKWNRIIDTIPLNKDGKKILSTINIDNLLLEDGLNSLVEEAKTENYIHKELNDITIEIQSSQNKKIDLSKFEESLQNDGIQLNVDYVDNSSKEKSLQVEKTKIDKKDKKYNNTKNTEQQVIKGKQENEDSYTPNNNYSEKENDLHSNKNKDEGINKDNLKEDEFYDKNNSSKNNSKTKNKSNSKNKEYIK